MVLATRGNLARGAAVAGREDLPVLQVWDRSLDGGAESDDASVVDLVASGAFLTRWFACRGEHAGAHVAKIANALPFCEGLGEWGRVPGVHVVAGARDGLGHREQFSGQGGCNLQVAAGVAVLAGKHGGIQHYALVRHVLSPLFRPMILAGPLSEGFGCSLPSDRQLTEAVRDSSLDYRGLVEWAC
jgi:hypothetical protein